MLRTIFMVGLFALVGIAALNLIFGLLPILFHLLFWLVGLALKIALVGLVVYFVIRIFSPETARRLKERWSGTAP